MVEFTLKLFANGTFKLLKSLEENQVKVKGIYCIPLLSKRLQTLTKYQN
ncbi:TPA: hypothetical protein ACGORU_001913 [Streptococcus suis]